MDYYTLLDFEKEPFSNSPDPEAFYHSNQHTTCLQKLELGIRMRRGLHVVIGDVGTGKTTLCRQLLRKLGQDGQIECHLVLDPSYNTAMEFLQAVTIMFEGKRPEPFSTELELKERIKQYLYEQGVEHNKTILLIVDEGQKISDYCLEILREFLNYETNDSKLLQIVIFAQKEFEQVLGRFPNFVDRISLKQELGALGFQETAALIRYRMERASGSGAEIPDCFSPAALGVIYFVSKGFPRKIINLCHQIMVSMLVNNSSHAGFGLALRCSLKCYPGGFAMFRKLAVGAGAMLALLAAFFLFGSYGMLHVAESSKEGQPLVEKAADIKSTPEPREQAVTEVESRHSSSAVVVNKTDDLLPKIDSPPQQAQKADVLPVLEDGIFQPDTLGAITVGVGDTLGAMIRAVYGPYSFTPGNTRTVLAINPHLSNPNRLEVGEKVAFPAIALPLTKSASEVYWLRVKLASHLQEAFDFVCHWSDWPMLILPSRNAAGTRQFYILMQEFYERPETVEAALANLPNELSQEALIFKGLDRRLVYYE